MSHRGVLHHKRNMIIRIMKIPWAVFEKLSVCDGAFAKCEQSRTTAINKYSDHHHFTFIHRSLNKDESSIVLRICQLYCQQLLYEYQSFFTTLEIGLIDKMYKVSFHCPFFFLDQPVEIIVLRRKIEYFDLYFIQINIASERAFLSFNEMITTTFRCWPNLFVTVVYSFADKNKVESKWVVRTARQWTVTSRCYLITAPVRSHNFTIGKYLLTKSITCSHSSLSVLKYVMIQLQRGIISRQKNKTSYGILIRKKRSPKICKLCRRG